MKAAGADGWAELALGPTIRIRTDAGEEGLELEEFEARVRRGELAPHCPVCLPAVTGSRFVRADELEIFRRLHQPRELYFSRAFKLGRFPRLTALFILFDAALYAVMTAHGPIDDDALVQWGAKVAPLILDAGQYWRLLTANLLHKDALHIAFNLFVLFNVGGTLENVFRPLDYLLLLLASALGTTALSLWMLPDASTAGASGIVYGALGGAVVFGVKYRNILPPRYRRILGEAIIPTVLVFLYIGFTSAGVDSWAHVGGLLAGAATALFLKPRLLHDAPPTLSGVLPRLIPFGAAAAVLTGLSLWGTRLPLSMTAVSDDSFGIEAEVPSTWRKGMDRFGQMAFSNGLPELGRAWFTAQAQLVAPGSALETAAQDYVRRQLVPEERAGAIRDVNVGALSRALFAGREALQLRGSYADEGRVTELQAFFVPRGELVYELVFQWPADYPAYEDVVARIAAGIRIVEPRAVREARARALLDPSGKREGLVLADTLSRLGRKEGAAALLTRAASALPLDAEILSRLAAAKLSTGDVEGGCAAAARALSAKESAAALESMADCSLAKHDRLRAASFLERARVASPDDERLLQRLQALGGGVE